MKNPGTLALASQRHLRSTLAEAKVVSLSSSPHSWYFIHIVWLLAWCQLHSFAMPTSIWDACLVWSYLILFHACTLWILDSVVSYCLTLPPNSCVLCSLTIHLLRGKKNSQVYWSLCMCCCAFICLCAELRLWSVRLLFPFPGTMSIMLTISNYEALYLAQNNGSIIPALSE